MKKQILQQLETEDVTFGSGRFYYVVSQVENGYQLQIRTVHLDKEHIVFTAYLETENDLFEMMTRIAPLKDWLK